MAGDTQANSVVHLVGMDKPFFTALAVCLSILAVIISVGGESRRWKALDDAVSAIQKEERSYNNEVNIWEIDGFNREKDIDAYLKANFGVDADAKFGKRKPPPVPKED